MIVTGRFWRLAKEVAWVGIGQVAAVIGALVLVRVITEYLAPQQYGELALGLTVAGLINQVVMGGVAAGIGRFYSIANEKQDLGNYMHGSRRLLGFATLAVAVIAGILLCGMIWAGSSAWTTLAAAALVYSVLSGYNMSLNGIQNAARQRALVAFHGGVDAWMKILLAVGAMTWLGRSSAAVVVGYALSSLLVTGSQFLFLRRTFRSTESEERSAGVWERTILAYSWPFSLWGVFTWAQQASDRWALQTSTSTEQVGMYAVVFQLGYVPIVLAATAAMTFLGPILYQSSGAGTDPARNTRVHRIAWRITVIGLLITFLAFVLAYILHEYIFDVLVDKQYRKVSPFFPWMVLAGGIFSAGQMLALKLMSDINSAGMITAKIVTALLGVALNMYGAAQFGITGVVAATVTFSIVFFSWMAWLAQHPSTTPRHHIKSP